MQSFAKRVKEQLAEIEPKKKCCRFTDQLSKAIEATKKENCSDTIRDGWEKCRCDQCRVTYLRRLFSVYGSVTDPLKSYHLDFTFHTKENCDAVEEILEQMELSFRRTTRKDKHVLYIKDSASIEEFLVTIGASGAAFDLMNEKIVRDFRNGVNRQVNCDTANIEKQLAAGKKYIEAIEKLIKANKIDALPEELRETARLRLENDQLSLTDLGKLFSPTVSKSGIRHRLERILRFAEENLK